MEAVNLAKQLLLKFEKNNITVIRVGLQSTDEISENGSVGCRTCTQLIS